MKEARVLRVSHITASTSAIGGGIPAALKSLTLAQNRAGIAIRIVGHDDGGIPLSEWPKGCPTSLVTSNGIPGLPWARTMLHEVRGNGATLLHTHGLWSQGSIVVPQVAHRTGAPYVISPHGMLDAWALKNSAAKKRVAALLFENRHLRRAACFHALCESEAKAIRAYGLKNPICIIPNGVDLIDAEKRIKIPGRAKNVLLFLGRIHPKKGLKETLCALANLQRSNEAKRHGNDWQFVIAGWDQGGHEADLKRVLTDLDLAYSDVVAADFLRNPSEVSESAVVFVGPAFGETKDALLRQADAFILPSFSEGLPMSVLEAWSYDLPVLMTDHCNLPEGFAADAAIRIGTDARSITEGLRLLNDTPLSSLQVLGANGRRLVSERFTWDKVAAEMKQVYRWVLGGGETPHSIIK